MASAGDGGVIGTLYYSSDAQEAYCERCAVGRDAEEAYGVDAEEVIGLVPLQISHGRLRCAVCGGVAVDRVSDLLERLGDDERCV